jgi:hypothetical protein
MKVALSRSRARGVVLDAVFVVRLSGFDRQSYQDVSRKTFGTIGG